MYCTFKDRVQGFFVPFVGRVGGVGGEKLLTPPQPFFTVLRGAQQPPTKAAAWGKFCQGFVRDCLF